MLIIYSDEFDGSTLCSEWQWVNPRGNCSYELNSEPSLHGVYPRAKGRVRGHAWLEIRAVSGCKLERGNNFNAPRLLQEISGGFDTQANLDDFDKLNPASQATQSKPQPKDFAIETKMSSAANSATEAMPTVGGLLVWKDENNHIRFERGMHGMHGKNEIGLSGSVEGKWDYFGRGILVSETVYLRLEDTWYKLKAVAEGKNLEFYINDELLILGKAENRILIFRIGDTGISHNG